ncbi:type II secretion system F family protein [Halosimplex halophilum]|uniref:type II secretion system F family protein n=1 Tax=Halosimplex halophilum TaxID=2559572 RepID=UPI00107F27AB|nr:type II secretion system F family protein [Halosimplex halophilum]
MATENPPATSADGTVAFVDRALYALFSRRADSAKHERDRHRYRAADLGTSFDIYISRVYGLSWALATVAFAVAVVVLGLLPRSALTAVLEFAHGAVPVLDRVALPVVPPVVPALAAGVVAGAVVRWGVVRSGGLYLRWQADARRADIETTLPGAVRYLRVLASGSSDQRAMLRRVADQRAYGETATAFRRALNEAALTGSLDAGLELVARDTPSRDLLAPFLLKYREHANQGTDALAEYLRMESRLLSHQQSRTHDRVAGYLELLAELFVVMLVFPALTVLIITVMSVLAPGLSATVATPLGPVTAREVLIYSSIAFVLGVGLATAAVVASLRPAQHAIPGYEVPRNLADLVRSVPTNPASAAVVCAPLAAAFAVALWTLGYRPANVLLVGYVGFGLPVGFVAVRRARIDEAKDREIRDFVHAIAGHVALGQPFSTAVDEVADEVDHGALQPDVESLAFSLSLTTDAGSGDGDVRAAALDKFVDDVGTPMAEQTMGLVVGALESGSDTEQVFEALQTEVGRLYHERKRLRSTLLVYVAVGWTTGLLVLGIMVAVNVSVLDGFSQLASVSNVEGSASGFALDPDAVRPAREQWRFYLVTQATMLSCGWFAGMASRGRYEALLHSAGLVGITYAVFAGAGML